MRRVAPSDSIAHLFEYVFGAAIPARGFVCFGCPQTGLYSRVHAFGLVSQGHAANSQLGHVRHTLEPSEHILASIVHITPSSDEVVSSSLGHVINSQFGPTLQTVVPLEHIFASSVQAYPPPPGKEGLPPTLGNHGEETPGDGEEVVGHAANSQLGHVRQT